MPCCTICQLSQGELASLIGTCREVVARSDLLYAIRLIRRGQIYIHPAMMPDILANAEKKKISPEEMLWQSLSKREQQVTLAVAIGHTSREIGEKYFLSEKTVSTYRARAMTKLGIDTRAELVKFVAHHKPSLD